MSKKIAAGPGTTINVGASTYSLAHMEKISETLSLAVNINTNLLLFKSDKDKPDLFLRILLSSKTDRKEVPLVKFTVIDGFQFVPDCYSPILCFGHSSNKRVVAKDVESSGR